MTSSQGRLKHYLTFTEIFESRIDLHLRHSSQNYTPFFLKTKSYEEFRRTTAFPEGLKLFLKVKADFYL